MPEYVTRETAVEFLAGIATAAYFAARDRGERVTPANEAGVHAVVGALAVDPELAALVLGLERGVESRVNASAATVEERDVLRYPWTETNGA